MMNSADALVRPAVRRQAFAGSKLIEYGSVSGKQLGMKWMIEAIEAVARRGRDPAAAPRNEAAIAQGFESPRDRQR